MKKDRKRIIILLATLLILLAAFFGLRAFNDREEERIKEEEQASQVEITKLSALQSISYKNETGEISLTKQEDQWVFSDEPKVKLDQSYITAMESAITDLTATRELEDPDELSYYGLEEPVCEIRAEDEDGTETTIYVGNGTDSDYYLTADDKEKVYTGGSSLMSAVQYEKKQLIENDTVPSIGKDNVAKITIQGLEDGDVSYTAKDNEDEIGTILGGVGALSFGDCEDYNVTGKALAGYGLNKKSRITLTITYKDDDKEKNFCLYIGKPDDTSTYRYVQVKDSNIVNKALTDTVDNLLNQNQEKEE